MASPQIPPPDPNGVWHFTYVTYDTDGRWYGGKRSTKKSPLTDPYLGSGNWIRNHPERARLKRDIIAFYPSSEAVFAAEAEMITWGAVTEDPLCMNICEGGRGMTTEAARRYATDPSWREAHTAGLKRKASDPVWREAHAAAMQRMYADPIYKEAQAVAAKRMYADPSHRETHAVAVRRLHADPTWKEVHAAGLKRMHADPKWQEANAAAVKRRSVGRKWKEAHSAAMKRRSADPAWQEAHAAFIKGMAANPKWKEAMAAGQQRRWAAWRVAKAEMAAAESVIASSPTG
jgi:hypothetical protein